MNITIKKEFRDLILPLTPEELSLLEQSILDHGVRDPLVIWRNSRDYLLDGHHRYQVIKKHSIKKYPTKVLKLKSKQEALNWIIQNQLARRNCTPEAISYLRGLRYRNEKLSYGGDRKSSPQNANLKTCKRIADEYKVNQNTILRDEKFTSAIDNIINIFPSAGKKKQVKNDLLTKQYKLSKKDMMHNDACPDISVNAETFEVFVDGASAMCEPIDKITLGQRYIMR